MGAHEGEGLGSARSSWAKPDRTAFTCLGYNTSHQRCARLPQRTRSGARGDEAGGQDASRCGWSGTRGRRPMAQHARPEQVQPVAPGPWGGADASGACVTSGSSIGIFDSGMGGLTVARAIARALPHESVYYLGDTKRCPYGVRSADEIRGFVRQIGAWFAQRSVKLVVIACNTATAAALPLAPAHVRRAGDRRHRPRRPRRHPVDALPARGRHSDAAHHSLRRVRARHPPHRRGRGGRVARHAALRAARRGRACHRPPPARGTGAATGTSSSTTRCARWWRRTCGRWRARASTRSCWAAPTSRCSPPPSARCLGRRSRSCPRPRRPRARWISTLRRRHQLAMPGSLVRHRFATTADDITTFAAAGQFIFGRPLASIERVDLRDTGESRGDGRRPAG